MASLKDVVVEELWNMKLRCLDGSPAQARLGEVGQMYLDDFRRAGLKDADADRLREGFQRVALEAERFPPPAAILKRLPPRYVKPAAETSKSQLPPTSPEDAEKNIQILKRMIRGAGLPVDDEGRQ